MDKHNTLLEVKLKKEKNRFDIYVMMPTVYIFIQYVEKEKDLGRYSVYSGLIRCKN